MAAQTGVRYSITNPDAYIMSNVIGFYNILETCRPSHDGIDNYRVPATYADVTAFQRDFVFTPKIALKEGLRKFAQCHKDYNC